MESPNGSASTDGGRYPDGELLAEKNTQPARKKQFRFNEIAEVALLKQVLASAPWEASHGNSQKNWDEVAVSLRSAGLEVNGRRVKIKLESLINAWRRQCAKEEKQSGVAVAYSEKEVMLEDIRTQLDDWSAHGRQAVDSANKARIKAQAEGKDIRKESMSGMKRQREPSDEDGEKDEIVPSSSSSRRRRSSGSFEESFAELKDSFVENAETRMRLREKELVVESKRIEMEEKRLEMEIKDREAARDAQSSTMNAMLSLMKTITENMGK
jgi:hypothetical protein